MKCHTDLLNNLGDISALCDSAEVALATRNPADRIVANAMTRSGWVLLCGYFEGFIRDLAEESIEFINDKNIDINSIPSGLFCSILDGLPAKYRQSGDQCLLSFKNAIKSGAPIPLNAKQLSKVGGNPTVDTVEGLFENLGIVSIIDTLTVQHFSLESTYSLESQAEPLRAKIMSVCTEAGAPNAPAMVDGILAAINGKWAPKKKRREVGYVALIQELLKIRNRIAHGEGRDLITPKELRDYKEQIGKLCTGMHDLALNALKKWHLE